MHGKVFGGHSGESFVEVFGGFSDRITLVNVYVTIHSCTREYGSDGNHQIHSSATSLLQFVGQTTTGWPSPVKGNSRSSIPFLREPCPPDGQVILHGDG
jgi:hypothetical protein